MRVVLDTNVFISSVLVSKGYPAKILDAWRKDSFDLLVSPKIVAEVTDVLRRPRIRKKHDWSDEEIDGFIEGLVASAIVVSGGLEVKVIKDDPDDDKYLACAEEGGADYIISGDRHLRKLGSYEGIKIVSPREFWEILKI